MMAVPAATAADVNRQKNRRSPRRTQFFARSTSPVVLSTQNFESSTPHSDHLPGEERWGSLCLFETSAAGASETIAEN